MSTLNKIMTHNLPPAMSGCKSDEVVNASGNFVDGTRKQEAGEIINY